MGFILDLVQDAQANTLPCILYRNSTALDKSSCFLRWDFSLVAEAKGCRKPPGGAEHHQASVSGHFSSVILGPQMWLGTPRDVKMGKQVMRSTQLGEECQLGDRAYSSLSEAVNL